MQEPTIICPKCHTEIKLTESLAAPLVESTRRQYEEKIAQKDADVRKREAAMQERAAALEKAQESIDAQVATKLKTQREAIAIEETLLAKQIANRQQENAAITQKRLEHYRARQPWIEE